MAGTLSACPRNESALGDAAAAQGGSPATSLLAGAGIFRLLQGAALLHIAALVYAALFHPISLPSLAIIVTGLIVTLVALRVPQLVAAPAADAA
ncbi:MAG TPA: hypothetical protein VEA77_04280, partial [Hyphomicrobium sp.]|nr:hypothetical protein [Hyphomicrobium sp.]